MLDFISFSIDQIMDYVNINYHDKDKKFVKEDDIYLVWSSKTLQNKKAIFAVSGHGLLIESTYNGDKDEIYLDIYGKLNNIKYGGDSDYATTSIISDQ